MRDDVPVETEWTETTLGFAVPVDDMGLSLRMLRYSVQAQMFGESPGLALEGDVILHVPEPSSIALASLGVVGLLAHRFRRQRRR